MSTQMNIGSAWVKIGGMFLTLLMLHADGTCKAAWAAGGTAVGQATIYSDKFNGRKTSTGQTFNNNQVSAASNKLPLGSKVQVKNKKTGKTATVTITDRTAKNAHCAVDLSKGAARKLGVKGKAPVVAKVVGKGTGRTK